MAARVPNTTRGRQVAFAAAKAALAALPREDPRLQLQRRIVLADAAAACRWCTRRSACRCGATETAR